MHNERTKPSSVNLVITKNGREAIAGEAAHWILCRLLDSTTIGNSYRIDAEVSFEHKLITERGRTKQSVMYSYEYSFVAGKLSIDPVTQSELRLLAQRWEEATTKRPS